MHEKYDKTAFMILLGIISIMRGEKKRPTGGMHGVVRRREAKTSKSMRMFLLAGIASVCGLRWNTVHVVVAQEAAR